MDEKRARSSGEGTFEVDAVNRSSRCVDRNAGRPVALAELERPFRCNLGGTVDEMAGRLVRVDR